MSKEIQGTTEHLGPHETAFNLFTDMMFWQNIALQAMQEIVDTYGSADFSAPVSAAGLMEDTLFQERLRRVEMTEYTASPGKMTVELRQKS